MAQAFNIELVAGPLEVYWATVGTAFPDVDSTPGGSWTKIGSSGAENYEEDGVIVTMDQRMEIWRSLGSAHPKEVFRTEQELHCTLMLADLDFDQLRVAFNLISKGTAAGPPAIATLNLDFTLSVNDMALLVRGDGKSPEFATGGFQVEFNRVVEMGAHSYEFTKGAPAVSALDFISTLDASGNVGQIVAQTA